MCYFIVAGQTRDVAVAVRRFTRFLPGNFSSFSDKMTGIMSHYTLRHRQNDIFLPLAVLF